MTRVLPDPGPASTSKGPSRCSPAAAWLSVKPDCRAMRPPQYFAETLLLDRREGSPESAVGSVIANELMIGEPRNAGKRTHSARSIENGPVFALVGANFPPTRT